MVLILWLFGLTGWLMWFRERGRSRDYATELSQLIHDYDLGVNDLRRSLKHREIRKRVGEQEDD